MPTVDEVKAALKDDPDALVAYKVYRILYNMEIGRHRADEIAASYDPNTGEPECTQ